MTKTETLEILDLIMTSFKQQPNQFCLDVSVTGTNVGVQANNSSGNVVGMQVVNSGIGVGYSSSINQLEIQQNTSQTITKETKLFIDYMQTIREELAKDKSDNKTIANLLGILTRLALCPPVISGLLKFVLKPFC